jgi:hypothetical protein
MPVLAGSWVMEAIEILMGTGVGLRGLGGTTDFIFLLPFFSRAPDSSSTMIGSRSAQTNGVLQCFSTCASLLQRLRACASWAHCSPTMNQRRNGSRGVATLVSSHRATQRGAAHPILRAKNWMSGTLPALTPVKSPNPREKP